MTRQRTGIWNGSTVMAGSSDRGRDTDLDSTAGRQVIFASAWPYLNGLPKLGGPPHSEWISCEAACLVCVCYFGNSLGGSNRLAPLVAEKTASRGRQAPDFSIKANVPCAVLEFTGGEVLR